MNLRANETYSEAQCQFSDRNRDVLINVLSPHKWSSTLKSRSSFPPLVSGVVDWCASPWVRLICCQIILIASSQGTLLICRSRNIRLLVLPPPLPSDQVRPGVSCCTWTLMVALIHWACFPLFLTRTADVMIPRQSVVFRWLVRLSSFPACWRQTNVTPIPKGPSSSSVANYRLISITSVLSKVFERLVSLHLRWFMECSGVFQPPSLFIGRSWYLWCTFRHVPYTAKYIGEWAGG